jgi:hypothetical protein
VKGEPAWPPVTLFKAMLIAVWHDVSHVRLAEALGDRASFRRFCSFSANEPTPEQTAFVRVRVQFVVRGHGRALLVFLHPEAQLRTAPHTMAGIGQSYPTDSPHRHRLKPSLLIHCSTTRPHQVSNLPKQSIRKRF